MIKTFCVPRNSSSTYRGHSFGGRGHSFFRRDVCGLSPTHFYDLPTHSVFALIHCDHFSDHFVVFSDYSDTAAMLSMTFE